VVAKLIDMKLPKAAELVREGIEETLSYYAFPAEHWRRIRTNNPLERVMKEIRRRTRVVGAFPDGESALMLVGANVRKRLDTTWGTQKYLDMDLFVEPELETQVTA
jgi:putative transposase